MRKGPLESSAGRKARLSRPPLRALVEMADEFDISVKQLASWLRVHGGPECAVRNRDARNAAAWYDPKAMRTWWNSLPEDVRKGKTK